FTQLTDESLFSGDDGVFATSVKAPLVGRVSLNRERGMPLAVLFGDEGGTSTEVHGSVIVRPRGEQRTQHNGAAGITSRGDPLQREATSASEEVILSMAAKMVSADRIADPSTAELTVSSAVHKRLSYSSPQLETEVSVL